MEALNTSASDALVFLQAARLHHTQTYLAQELGVDVRTIRRWELRETEPPSYLIHALQQLLPFQTPLLLRNPAFRFIDLFAGIGGMRMPFEELGGQCVFTSEWDRYAQKTYAKNFPDTHEIAGDITKIDARDIPDHDLLLAGFPCQPFSIAGVSKKNALGRAHGFADETQGTLFFDVARIINEKRPEAFLLENVKNLRSHDRGRTFAVILKTLQDELGYEVHWRVIDAAHFVPQHRERIMIAGFRNPSGFTWDALQLPEKGLIRLSSILHGCAGEEPFLEWDEDRYVDPVSGQARARYTLSDRLWQYLQDYAAKHRAKGNGFGYGLAGPDSVARTLSARYYKDGSEILVPQDGKNPRRLTPRECARLMGFSDNFKIPVSDTRAYQQFGNSVAVPVVREIARVMKQFITERDQLQPSLLMQS